QLIKVMNTGASNYNSPYNVFRWLPENTFDSTADINITTMSTSEFIGQINDINENYDFVYLGDSTSGFYLSGGWPNYNDPDLDGMLYTNIGDIYNSNLRLVGLLDRDYYSNGNINTSAPRSYRFSGNDITATKKTQLENFAASGFPVILASNLVNDGSAATQESAFTAQVTSASSGGTITLTAVPRLTSSIPEAEYSYQWYSGTPSGGSSYSISGATGSTYVPTTPGNYYCEVVLLFESTPYIALSNYVTVQKDSYRVSEDSGAAQPVGFYPININRSGSYYYVDVSGGSVSSYQWYYRTSSGGTWQAIGGTNSYYYYFSNSNYYFMCRVNIGGANYYSQQIKRNGSSYLKSDFSGTYATTVATLTLGASYETGSNGVTFTANAEITPATFSSTMYYAWYGPNYNYLTSSFQTPWVEEGSYYCRAATATMDDSARSSTFTVTSGLIAIVQGGGTRAIIPARAAVASTINSDRVDNSSILYTTLSGILPKQNVMPASEAMEQRETVLKYLNLSKPSIEFSNKPEDYSGTMSSSLVTGQTLTYSFRILNPTDSTPTATRYACKLYLDQNADGRYVDGEELTDLTITSNGKQVDADALMASTASGVVQYTVSRTLPNNFSGIIPWKLEVVKVGAEQIHASEVGYTYIKPDMLTLNILQISSYSGGGGTRFSLEAQNQDPSSMYGQLFQQLRNNGVYNIQITTRTVSQLNGSGWTLNSSESAFDTNHNGKLDTQDELYHYLNSFNMLILGFGDGYGYGETGNGLSETVAKAVVQYIAGNKAVLFTHDTTSFINLPYESRYLSMYSGQWYWGYYFNSVIRSAVGLDRYGVTDPTYGVTKYSPINTKPGSGPIANAYAGFDSTLAATLTGKGYSIAYEPDGGRADTVLETQGYSALTMLRYSNDRSQQMPLSTIASYSGESSTTVSTVSQVNQGQITTFPYVLNSVDFGGTRTSSLSVGTTHEQYYQLNMNSDDIVVWYCLSGSRFDAMKHDVINNYYIYNRGNVTYSGAGHLPGAVTQDEAKLFVNTMIAAYRAGAVQPTVNFTAANRTDINSFFLSTEYTSTQQDDYSGRILVSDSQAEERATYFVLSDPNLAAGKTTSVEFYYANDSGSDVTIEDRTVKATKLDGIQLYRVDDSGTQTAVSDAGLRSGILYKLYLPDQVLDAFAGSSDASLSFYIRAVTTINGTDYIGANTLTLRKLGLLSIC
ncbi:MAG: DUF5057 domain-containing protein, partial [Lawsonibacter sp.]|nr:DUF5057 domain-containing protein [Lawsonibacter sp.]